MRRMRASILGVTMAAGLLAACATQPRVTTPRTYQGAGAGAAVGAGAGALIDSHNRWRGAVLGGTLGALAGGTLTEISTRAAQEAASQNQAVAYQTVDGFQRVEARPAKRTVAGCRTVQERIYQNGRLMQERTREVC